MPKHVMGLLSGPGMHRIVPGPAMTSEEVNRYEHAVEFLETFHRSRRLLSMLDSNLVAFLAVKDALTRSFIEKRHNRKERIRLFDDLNRTFANFLSSIRLFRDHTLARLSHTYGRNARETNAFKTQWSDAVQDDFAFGFMWEFRNYVQHYGLPFDTGRAGFHHPDAMSKDPDVELGISRTVLLRYKNWGHLRAGIEALSTTVAVHHYVEPALQALQHVDNHLVGMEIPALTQHSQTALSIVKPGFKNGAYPGTMDVPDMEFREGLLNFQLLPIDIPAHLGLVEIEDTPAGPRTRLVQDAFKE